MFGGPLNPLDSENKSDQPLAQAPAKGSENEQSDPLENIQEDDDIEPAEREQPKKRKRKKIDGQWTRRSEQHGKKVDPSQFKPAGIFHLMRVAGSPKKIIAINDNKSSPFKPVPMTLSKELTTLSPSKLPGPLSFAKSPEKIETEEGVFKKVRTLRFSHWKMSLYLPSHKVQDNDLIIPPVPSDWIKSSPVPKASLAPLLNIKIDKQIIEKSEKAKQERQRKGEANRSINQNKLMKISAAEALTKAGVPVESSTVHWTHFKSHSHFDEEAQDVENLGLATKEANAAMELVNRVIRKLVFRKTTPQILYISYIPTWVEGYENIRLLKHLEMRISDTFIITPKSRKVSITFNMLSRANICVSEIEPIEQALMKEFDGHEERLQQVRTNFEAFQSLDANDDERVESITVENLPLPENKLKLIF